MILSQRVTVSASTSRVWDFVMDVPAVARCVPGVESIEAIDADTFLGVLRVRVGPVGVRFEGRLVVTDRNPDELRAEMSVEATDRRIRGSVHAKSTMQLTPQGDHTVLAVDTDAAIAGKLGEFGQAIMRRKADQIIDQFARNMAQEIEATANP